jgi:hypothetical protein
MKGYFRPAVPEDVAAMAECRMTDGSVPAISPGDMAVLAPHPRHWAVWEDIGAIFRS